MHSDRATKRSRRVVIAETREALGSFFLIDAADLNEAIRVASMHPAASLGEKLGWGVEIRPIETCRARGIAAAADRRALALPRQEPERRFLAARLAALAPNRE